MEMKKQYIYIFLLYTLSAVYVILDNQSIITVLLILALFVYHIVSLSGALEKLSSDKHASVTKLQHKLEATKKESEEKEVNFLSLTQTIGSGVIVINDEGTINFANKDIEEFFHKDINQLSYEDLNTIPPLYKFITHAYLSEKKLHEQAKYKEQFYEFTSTPIFEDKFFKGTIIIVHDVTLIKTAEDFQKRFTADVSHELKTPLASIKGLSEILIRDSNMDKKDREEFISLINKESNRMETILKDLLIISKMDRLDYELKKKDTNVKELLSGVVSSLQRHAQSKNIEIKVEVENSILFVDPVKLEQVFINLVKNAINYTDKGMIEVTGNEINNDYVIQVRDTGIGIDSEDLENIFKRFFRVDNARSRDTGGSGLGLSISKNVILKHGGEISVESIENKGSTFTVKLPLEK